MVVVQGLLVVGAVCSVVVGRVGIGGAGCLRCMHVSFGVVVVVVVLVFVWGRWWC